MILKGQMTFLNLTLEATDNPFGGNLSFTPTVYQVSLF